MGKIQKAKALWKDRKNQSSYAKWIWHYTKPYLGKLIWIVLLGAMSTVVTLAFAVASKYIIDYATAGMKTNALVMVAVYVGLTVLSLGLYAGLSALTTITSERVMFDLRHRVYHQIMTSKWLQAQGYHTGDLVSRVIDDVANVTEGIVETIPNIVSLLIEILLVFFTLFYYSPLLAVFSLVVAPIGAFICARLGSKIRVMQTRTREADAAYQSHLQENLANIMVVKAFSGEQKSEQNLQGLREKRFYWIMKRMKFTLVNSLAMSEAFQLGYVAALTYGAIQISAGVITYGTMSVFLQLVNQLQGPIVSLISKVPHVASVLASAGRIREMEDMEPEDYTHEEIIDRVDVAEDHQPIGVCIENLDFGYTDDLVLQNLSLQIEPGQTVAVVGESGIGKTTLIRLIMALVTQQQGTVTYFTKDGQNATASAGNRTYLSYVPQGNTLFSGTIRENICMGNPNASDEEIWELLDVVAATKFVKKLPKGLDTVIGERGHGLSEGQAQRLAIARAMIKHAPFLILDEATSALDESTELRVIDGIRSLNPRPTCLVITHRKGILQYCDREIVLANRTASEK